MTEERRSSSSSSSSSSEFTSADAPLLPEHERAREASPDPGAIALLVIANLVPVAGVMFWGWKVGQVVAMYWMENLIVGFYNVLRIWAAAPEPFEKHSSSPAVGKAVFSAFFALHYGFFCYGHGTFIAGMLPLEGGRFLGVDDMVVKMLRDPVTLGCLAALMLSHGWSFYRNYLGHGEYMDLDGPDLMTGPYKRIFVTHVFIIFGSMVVMFLKAEVAAMLLFIAIKVGFDIHFHRREHWGKMSA